MTVVPPKCCRPESCNSRTNNLLRRACSGKAPAVMRRKPASKTGQGSRKTGVRNRTGGVRPRCRGKARKIANQFRGFRRGFRDRRSRATKTNRINNQITDSLYIFYARVLLARSGDRLSPHDPSHSFKLGAARIAGAWQSLADCSTTPTNAQVGVTAGAVIGGVVGPAMTGGISAGTVACAGAGAAVGHEIGRRVK